MSCSVCPVAFILTPHIATQYFATRGKACVAQNALSRYIEQLRVQDNLHAPSAGVSKDTPILRELARGSLLACYVPDTDSNTC